MASSSTEAFRVICVFILYSIPLTPYCQYVSDRTIGLYMCEHECLQRYFEAFRAVLNDYGVPEALYADRIGIYFVNTKKPENWSIEEHLAGKHWIKRNSAL
jgi:hypothetical protein